MATNNKRKMTNDNDHYSDVNGDETIENLNKIKKFKYKDSEKR